MILYNVNKEKRIVVARFAGMEQAVRRSLMDSLDIEYGLDLISILNKYHRRDRFKMTGVAICHESDTWDENVGKKLAKQRLLRQYHVLRHEILIDMKKSLNSYYTQIMNKINAKINKYAENAKLHAGHIL